MPPFHHSLEKVTIPRRIVLLLFRVIESISGRFFSIDRCTSQELLINFYSGLNPKLQNIKHIRLGGEQDGGYLVPDDLQGDLLCISPGYGGRMLFELELLERNIPSVIIDRELPQLNLESITEIKAFLDTYSNPDELVISLHDVIEQMSYSAGTDLILQMDIEGGEYKVMQALDLTLLGKFRILVIEFHSLYLLKNEYWFNNVANSIFQKLSLSHEITHVNVNKGSGCWSIDRKTNFPDTLEITFLRKDRINENMFEENQISE